MGEGIRPEGMNFVKLKVPLQVPLKVQVKVRIWSGHGQVKSGQVRL